MGPHSNPSPDSSHPDEPVPLPVDGVLDLHTFRPRDVKGVVFDYLEACRERGILEVRIIHGRGLGELRRSVHSLLARHPEVVAFAQAGETYGGWGATIVHLRPHRPAGIENAATT